MIYKNKFDIYNWSKSSLLTKAYGIANTNKSGEVIIPITTSSSMMGSMH